MMMKKTKRKIMGILACIPMIAYLGVDGAHAEGPTDATLVEEVPSGFTPYGEPAVTTEDCVTTTEQVYSRTTSGSEAAYTEWTEWAETQSGLLTEPVLPDNTDTHEYRVTGPVKVIDSEATDGVLSEWAWDSFTDWQESDTPPADPDGQSGEDNPLNLVQIGERYDQQVSNNDYVAPTEGRWSEGEWFNWTGGPVDGPPAEDADGWHGPLPNPPNGVPHNVAPGVYSTSDQGNASYFKHTAEWIEGDPGHSETFHTEYRWSVYKRTFTPGSEEQSHMEWGVEERTRTLIPGEEYVYTSVTTGEPCEEEPPSDDPKPEPPVVLDTPPVVDNTPPGYAPVPRQREPKQVPVPTAVDAGL